MHGTRSVLTIVIIATLASTAQLVDAQTRSGLFFGGNVAVASNPDDLIGTAAVGGHIGVRFPLGLVLLGEYLYAGKDFFFFDSGAGEWSKPVAWRDVPSGDSSRGDWLFYRRRHVVGGSAGVGFSVGDLGIYSTIGILLNIVDLSDAADSYPAFREAATESSIDNGNVLRSTAFRVGLVYPAQSLIAGQLSYVLIFGRDDLPDEDEYIRRNGLLMLGVVIQLEVL